jgi:dipeptidyl aminopeptidase/acylaminoacyl peptidase
MLIYPPGKFEAKRLPTFTWIHGGPQMADGNELRSPAPWAWFALAAAQGWLVFDPNYRGSTGYGDAFTLGFVPHVLSRPGKDILEGVEALVKDGVADPDQLTVGGYSNGGFLTNWLITQTTRFKAAVSGAGVVEYVAMWGNDEAPIYYAYSLGGVPWEVEANYNAEAAIWQIGKVTTPTHIVASSEDSNVPIFEAYLLERALQTRGVPHRLLIFPGEGHSLDKNPWHRKIKVREELKWLEKYGRKSP